MSYRYPCYPREITVVSSNYSKSLQLSPPCLLLFLLVLATRDNKHSLTAPPPRLADSAAIAGKELRTVTRQPLLVSTDRKLDSGTRDSFRYSSSWSPNQPHTGVCVSLLLPLCSWSRLIAVRNSGRLAAGISNNEIPPLPPM